MPTALSEQLADELGCSPADAEYALRDVLEDVERRVQDGERVSLPGLGTFLMDEGTLQFTPSPALQKAVNYRNAHLDSLSVSAAPSPASSDAEPPPAGATPDTAPTDDTPPPEPETADDVEPKPETVPAEDVAEEAARAEEEPPDTEEVPALSEDWADELDEQPEDTPAPPSASEGASPERRNTGQLIGLAASIVLLIGLVWFVLSSGLFPGSGAERGPAPSSTPAETTEATASAESPADTARPAPDEASDTARAETTASSSTPSSIDRATGGWTIVVASRTRPGQAKAVLSTYRQRFQGEGIPVDILTGESSGQLRYRVAIGQYPSQEAAQTALQQLQGRVPDDAWTLEIQPNS